MILADGWVPDALTEQAKKMESAWWVFLIAAGVVAFIVYGMIAVILVRYRRRDDQLPRQVHYRIGVEIAYTVIPVILVAGLIVATLRVTGETDDDRRRPRRRGRGPGVPVAVAVHLRRQRRRHHGSRPTTCPSCVLPVGRTVRFEVVSDDVIHSFWVPGFFYKRDLIPGTPQSFDVDMGDRTGTWSGACAEYCGLEHAAMRFELRIVEADEFDQWLAAGGTDRP